MLFWLLCLSIAPALAQQNQKIVFPTPANYQTSSGSSVTPAADGGYLVLGQVDGTNWNTFGSLLQPRVIKLDANLNTVWDNLYIPLSLPFGEYAFPKGDAFELPDGDILMGLHNDSSNVHLLRLNSDGSLQAEITLPAQYERSVQVLDIMDNGNFLVYVTANQRSIKHLDPNGNEVYSINVNYAPPTILSNGDLLYFSYNAGTGKTTFYRANNQGILVWQSLPIPGVHSETVALANGTFGASYFDGQAKKWHIRFFDDAGLQTSVSPELPIPELVSDLKAYPDGTFLVSGKTVTNRPYLLRVHADGTLLWSAESPEDSQSPLSSVSCTPTADGWAIGAGPTLSDEMGLMRVSANTGFFINTVTGTLIKDNNENCLADAGEPNIHYAKVEAFNNLEQFATYADWQGNYTLLLPSGDFTIITYPNEAFFYQCPTAPNTVSFAPNGSDNATLDLPIQSLDVIHEIKGKITLDENADCIADPLDPLARLWRLQLDALGETINLKTNNAGEYQVFVPSGSYTIKAIPWNSNFGICGQIERQGTFTGTIPQTQTEDFVAFPETDCPQMSVNICGEQVRPCTTSVFTVYYRNDGTITANDVAIDLTLDAGLEYISAIPAPASVVGNMLHFDLGNVPSADAHACYTDYIKVTVMPSCSLAIGQQVCVSAHITPDDPCDDPLAWQGAIVAVDAECASTSDSIIFRIRNIGNAANANTLNFIIDEDQIVLRQGTFQLPAGGQQIEVVLPMPPMSPDSTTVTITAGQEPGAPGPAPVVFSISNCNGISGGNPTAVGGGAGLYTDNKCFAVVNSFDPNDKTASPLGFGPDRLLQHGIPLEYTIRFQNTGNDTAFLVILRDTISDKMDRSRIELLGSSHPFDFAQINDSILHFRFDNILLPDSLTNPEGSQGFISFKIHPKSGLSDGTLVNNRAAIYFDQNPPIITNTVSRTYGKYFLVSTDEKFGLERVQVKVSPNPFQEETTFELPEDLPNHALQLEVYDPTGKLLRRMAFTGKTCQLRREGLANGLHFWSITDAGKVLASGKIVAGN